MAGREWDVYGWPYRAAEHGWVRFGVLSDRVRALLRVTIAETAAHRLLAAVERHRHQRRVQLALETLQPADTDRPPVGIDHRLAHVPVSPGQ